MTSTSTRRAPTRGRVGDSPLGRRMRRQARVMRIVNVPMRRLLALPVPTPLGRRLMLVTLTGRRTGRVYRQPVSYGVDGDALLTPGGGRWTANLHPEMPVRVRIRGRDRWVLPERVREPDALRPLLERMVAANPRITSFAPFLRADGVDDAALAAALDHGFCVVRWHPTTGPEVS